MSAFQRWFRIENRTIIKKNMAIFGNLWLSQTMGAPLLGWRPYNRDNTATLNIPIVPEPFIARRSCGPSHATN